MMKTGKRYSLGAGVADFYVLGTVGGAAAASYVAACRHPVPLWEPFLALALSLMTVMVYHFGLARRTLFRSPGELMMGRTLVGGVKHWSNPYSIGRGALFAVFLFALVGAGNSFDSAADERFYSTLTFPIVLGRTVVVSCLVLGMVMVGSGQIRGGFLIVAYFAFGAAGNLLSRPPHGVPESITRGLGAFGLFMTCVAALVLVRYHRAAANKALHPTAAGEHFE